MIRILCGLFFLINLVAAVVCYFLGLAWEFNAFISVILCIQFYSC